MTRARNGLVADRCRWPISSPMGVYGPTRKTSSRPMTSGGSSRLHRTPASHTRGNGSRPRASIQASGVHSTNSTTRVIAPDSIEVSSGSNAPGAVSADRRPAQDRWVSSAMTGPSRAIQMTAAPMIETIAEADRTRGGAGPVGLGSFGLAAQLTLDGSGDRALVAEDRRREHGEAALLVLGQAGWRERVLDERVPGRGGRADRGDVDDLRAALLGHAILQFDGGLLVGRGHVGTGQADLVRQLNVREVQLDGLGDERAGGIELPRLQRRI